LIRCRTRAPAEDGFPDISHTQEDPTAKADEMQQEGQQGDATLDEAALLEQLGELEVR